MGRAANIDGTASECGGKRTAHKSERPCSTVAGQRENSIELINSALGNASGQSWTSSASRGGTPGQGNSAARSDIAPLLLDVAHFPSVPKSTNSVAITARVRDEAANGVASVTLFYRDHTSATPGAFLAAAMLDDGAHGDGLAGDGVFGHMLSPMANGSIIEFYVLASDIGGNSRTWPAPTREANGAVGQLANALFQVDDETISNPMPAFRVIMTGSERSVFVTNDNAGVEKKLVYAGYKDKPVFW